MYLQAGICTATELAVPQHVNIHTDPVFNKTVLELAAHPQARYSTVQYSTVQYSTVQYSTVQYSAQTVLELAAHPQARYAAGKLGVFLEDKLFKSFEIF